MTRLFSKPVTELIAQRTSCRTYQSVPLEPATQAALERFMQQPVAYPFSGAARFALLDSGAAGREARKIGTYGTISGARYYLAGAVRRGPGALENFGYGLERLILHATDLGLGTCWLGGSLHRGEIAVQLGASAGEYVPAITPVGLPAGRPGLQDRLLRWGAGSRTRKPWEELFFWGGTRRPLTPETSGPYAPALEAVRRAPSASNRQPWRVIAHPRLNRFDFYLKRDGWYTQAARTFLQAEEIQRLDLGIAMCHFELAAREQGLNGRWSRPEEATPGPSGWEAIAVWKGLEARK